MVPKEYRHKGYASVLLKELMDLGYTKGATVFQLNSQLAVKALYSRAGFKVASDVYQVKLTGVDHIKMEYCVDG